MPIKNDLRIALIQMSCGEDPNENLERAMARVEEAAKVGAGVICLPELFRTPYFCQREDASFFDLAETIPGPTTQALSRLAKEHGTFIVPTLYTLDFIIDEGAENGTPEYAIEKAKAMATQQRERLGIAFHAGVKFAYGTDAAVFPH